MSTGLDRTGPPPTGLDGASARSGEAAGWHWLPGPITAEHEKLGHLAGSGQADVYRIRHRSGETRIAKIYRANTEIKDEILRQIMEARPPHVVRVLDFGRTDGRCWELLEYVGGGTLDDLVATEGPRLRPARVREILVQLHRALASVHALRIEHRDLKPENVLVRSRAPLDLAVTDFGIASLMDQNQRWSRVGRTLRYAPPEGGGSVVSNGDRITHGSTVFRTHWDHWSLGMMLVEMLAGRHPFEGVGENTIATRLAIMNVDELVEGVADPDWKRLCRGLLRREPDNRWGSEAISRWLGDPSDPKLVVAEEGAPTARGYRFVGRMYATGAELGEAFFAEWSAARNTWRHDRSGLLRWLQNDLGRADLVDGIETAVVALRAAVPPAHREDAETLVVAQFLAPGIVPRVDGIELSPKGIGMFLDRVLADGGFRDEKAAAALEQVLEGGFLKLCGPAAEGKELVRIGADHESALARHAAVAAELRQHGVQVSLSREDRLRLLGAQLPDGPQRRFLKARADRAKTPDAMECEWFARLAGRDDPTSLLVLPQARGAAEMATRALRAERDATAKERRYNRTVQRYGRMAGFSVGAVVGPMFGIVIGVVIGLFVEGGAGDSEAWTQEDWGIFYSRLILGSLIGGALIGGINFARRGTAWVQNSSRSAGGVRWAGIFITIPSILVAAYIWTHVHDYLERSKDGYLDKAQPRMSALSAERTNGDNSSDWLSRFSFGPSLSEQPPSVVELENLAAKHGVNYWWLEPLPICVGRAFDAKAIGKVLKGGRQLDMEIMRELPRSNLGIWASHDGVKWKKYLKDDWSSLPYSQESYRICAYRESGRSGDRYYSAAVFLK